jgi:hypothetical protein
VNTACAQYVCSYVDNWLEELEAIKKCSQQWRSRNAHNSDELSVEFQDRFGCLFVKNSRCEQRCEAGKKSCIPLGRATLPTLEVEIPIGIPVRPALACDCNQILPQTGKPTPSCPACALLSVNLSCVSGVISRCKAWYVLANRAILPREHPTEVAEEKKESLCKFGIRIFNSQMEVPLLRQTPSSQESICGFPSDVLVGTSE